MLQAPPYASAFAVPEDHVAIAGKRLPKLIVGDDWARHIGSLGEAIDTTPARKASVHLAAQSASLGTTPVPMGDVPGGIYRVSYTMRVTTPGTISSSLTLTISHTSGGVALSDSGAAMTGNTTATHQFGTLVLRVDADTPISYSTVYASAGATAMQYMLDVIIEELLLDAA